jgi:tetrahydromethanopterin S-methyltransferase subunit F
MYGISRDERLMGEFVSTKTMRVIYGTIIAIVAIAVCCMLWFSIH